MSPTADTTREPDEFAFHLTRHHVDEVLHHGHPMPVGKGLTSTLVAERYPGFHFNSLTGVFLEAGVIVEHTCHARRRCHWQVKRLHLDSDGTFLVEWDRDAADDGRWWPYSEPDAGEIAATG